MTVNQINEIKKSISGDSFKNHTKESLIKLNDDLYNDNYLGDLQSKTKVQIKNLLMKRLDMSLLDLEIAEKTGYDYEKITSLVKEMIGIIQEHPQIGILGKEDYDKTYKFLKDMTISNIRFDYSNDKTEDKKFFYKSMNNVVSMSAMYDTKYRLANINN